MLKLSEAVSVIALTFGLFSSTFAHTYIADTSASSLQWKGSKVTGFHEGTVYLKSGSLQIEEGKLQGGSFEIDLTTISSTDLSGGKKRKLDGHLKSKDFFSVKNFPIANLSITNVSGEIEKGSFVIDADLMVKGITKPVSFAAKISEEGDSMKAVAKVIVDRSKYDIKFKSGSFFENLGDTLIHDEFEVNVSLVLNRE